MEIMTEQEKAAKLSYAKKRRGAVRASITRMETTVGKLEAQASLSPRDQSLIPELIKKIETSDAEFKRHHQAILDLLDEDQETLEKEYEIYDVYDEKVTMITLSLRAMEDKSKSKSSPAPDTTPSQRMCSNLRDSN